VQQVEGAGEPSPSVEASVNEFKAPISAAGVDKFEPSHDFGSEGSSHFFRAVMKMSDGDERAVWREQVSELQKELQMATARMLSEMSQPQSRHRHTGRPWIM